MRDVPEPPVLADALRLALALSPQEQSRLLLLLQSLAGPPRLLDGDPVADTALATEEMLPPPEPVAAWLQRIACEPAWWRLQLLEEAMADCDAGDLPLLLQARSELLAADLPLAVRRSVTELASLHPVSVAVAALGLLLGLVGLARWLLRAWL